MEQSLFGKIFSALKADNLSAAERNIDKLLKTEVTNPNHYVKKGDISQRLNKDKKAVSAYHKAAYLFKEQGFLKKSLAMYKIILRLDPGNSLAMEHAEFAIRELEGMEEEVLQPVAVAEPVDISENAIFRPFSSSEIEEILRKAELKKYANGEVVISEDASGDSVFVIRKGTARVVTTLLGRDIELATLREGDIFGEVAFLTGRKRTASVYSKDELAVRELDRSILDEMIERKPEIMAYLDEIYSLRSKDREDKIKNV